MSDLPPPTVEHSPAAPSSRPAPAVYRRRRTVAIAGTIVVLGVGVAGGVTILGGGGDDEPELWNAVLAVDTAAGEVRLVAPDGDEIYTIDVDAAEPILRGTRGQYALLADFSSEDVVEIVDVSSGEATPIEVGDGEEARWLATSTAPLITVSSPDGGDLRLVNPATGEEIDVAQAADLDEPLILSQTVFATPDGSTAVMTDAKSFQTVIVGFDRDEAVFVPGQVAAVAADSFVTVQPAGETASMTFFTLDGEQQGVVDMSRPTSVAMLDDGTMLSVTVDGSLVRASAGEDEAEVLAQLDLEEREVPRLTSIPGVERLVVQSDTEAVLFDYDGSEISRTASTGLWSVPAGEPACFAVRDEQAVQLIDAEDGRVLTGVELPSDTLQPTSSVPSGGCTAVVPSADGGTSTLLTRDGDREIDGDVVETAPDGTAMLLRGVDGEHRTMQLRPLDEPDAEPVEIDATSATFVRR